MSEPVRIFTEGLKAIAILVVIFYLILIGLGFLGISLFAK